MTQIGGTKGERLKSPLISNKTTSFRFTGELHKALLLVVLLHDIATVFTWNVAIIIFKSFHFFFACCTT